MSRGCRIPRTRDTKSLFCSSNVKETAKSRRDLPDNAIPNTEQILGIKFQERLRDVHTEISNWLVNDLNGVERRLEIHGDLHCLTADASSHQILNKKSSKNKCYCCLQMHNRTYVMVLHNHKFWSRITVTFASFRVIHSWCHSFSAFFWNQRDPLYPEACPDAVYACQELNSEPISHLRDSLNIDCYVPFHPSQI